MVVVQMGDDHVLDRLEIDAEGTESLADRLRDLALAQLGAALVEAGVDHDGPAAADDQPDVVGERHRHVVRVAAQKILGRAPVDPRIGKRIDFVDVVAHEAFLPGES